MHKVDQNSCLQWLPIYFTCGEKPTQTQQLNLVFNPISSHYLCKCWNTFSKGVFFSTGIFEPPVRFQKGLVGPLWLQCHCRTWLCTFSCKNSISNYWFLEGSFSIYMSDILAGLTIFHEICFFQHKRSDKQFPKEVVHYLKNK